MKCHVVSPRAFPRTPRFVAYFRDLCQFTIEIETDNASVKVRSLFRFYGKFSAWGKGVGRIFTRGVGAKKDNS